MFDCLVKYSVGLAPFANASRGRHWEETWHRALCWGLALKAEGRGTTSGDGVTVREEDELTSPV